MTVGPPTPAEPWVEQWLSASRHGAYLAAAAGDAERALALYEWNTQLSAALMHDLAHLEVGLRNAYDRAITKHWTGPAHWTRSPARLFPPLYRRRPWGRVDVNARRRDQLQKAADQVDPADPTKPPAPPGKIIAELSFGFWRYLSSRAHEKTIWLPYLNHAFPAGTDRKSDVDDQMARLHGLRNRVAHHEPLLGRPIACDFWQLIDLAALVLPELGQHVLETSRVPALLERRP